MGGGYFLRLPPTLVDKATRPLLSTRPRAPRVDKAGGPSLGDKAARPLCRQGRAPFLVDKAARPPPGSTRPRASRVDKAATPAVSTRPRSFSYLAYNPSAVGNWCLCIMRCS